MLVGVQGIGKTSLLNQLRKEDKAGNVKNKVLSSSYRVGGESHLSVLQVKAVVIFPVAELGAADGTWQYQGQGFEGREHLNCWCRYWGPSPAEGKQESSVQNLGFRRAGKTL